MNAFIVYAHPEPKSFNGALLRRSVEVLMGLGHDVNVSDLYAMKFDPVSERRNFIGGKDPGTFKQQQEELYAAERSGFAPDIAAEMEIEVTLLPGPSSDIYRKNLWNRRPNRNYPLYTSARTKSTSVSSGVKLPASHESLCPNCRSKGVLIILWKSKAVMMMKARRLKQRAVLPAGFVRNV